MNLFKDFCEITNCVSYKTTCYQKLKKYILKMPFTLDSGKLKADYKAFKKIFISVTYNFISIMPLLICKKWITLPHYSIVW